MTRVPIGHSIKFSYLLGMIHVHGACTVLLHTHAFLKQGKNFFASSSSFLPLKL